MHTFDSRSCFSAAAIFCLALRNISPAAAVSTLSFAADVVLASLDASKSPGAMVCR